MEHIKFKFKPISLFDINPGDKIKAMYSDDNDYWTDARVVTEVVITSKGYELTFEGDMNSTSASEFSKFEISVIDYKNLLGI